MHGFKCHHCLLRMHRAQFCKVSQLSLIISAFLLEYEQRPGNHAGCLSVIGRCLGKRLTFHAEHHTFSALLS